MVKIGFYILMILKKLIKIKFILIFLIINFCFGNNIICDNSNFEEIILDIEKYGSNLNIVIGKDTINAIQVLSYNTKILTVDLLNKKWSNYKINQYFNEEYSKGSSVPYEIPFNQIDCIIEVNRPNILKEYAYLGFTALIFWGLISIFQLI